MGQPNQWGWAQLVWVEVDPKVKWAEFVLKCWADAGPKSVGLMLAQYMFFYTGPDPAQPCWYGLVLSGPVNYKLIHSQLFMLHVNNRAKGEEENERGGADLAVVVLLLAVVLVEEWQWLQTAVKNNSGHCWLFFLCFLFFFPFFPPCYPFFLSIFFSLILSNSLKCAPSFLQFVRYLFSQNLSLFKRSFFVFHPLVPFSLYRSSLFFTSFCLPPFILYFIVFIRGRGREPPYPVQSWGQGKVARAAFV